MKLSLVLPAYNEEALVRSSVRRVSEYLNSLGITYELIIGDDGSVDRTREHAREIDEPHVRLISEPHRGKGNILTACLREARGEYIGFLDIDLEIDVSYVSPMIDQLEGGADAAIASKVFEASESSQRSQRPLHRRLSTIIYNLVVRLLFGSSIKDHQAGLKIFRAEALKPVLHTINSTGWTWDTEVLLALAKDGRSIVEVPVSVQSRRDSRTDTLRTPMAAFIELARLYLRESNLGNRARERKEQP